MSIRGWHSCRGKWAIGGIEKRLRVSDLLREQSNIGQLKCINFSEIAIKPFGNMSKDDPRYINADVRFPCILAEDTENPDNKHYRLCDGRHRIKKLMDQGHDEAIFYIISNEDFMKVFNKADLYTKPS